MKTTRDYIGESEYWNRVAQALADRAQAQIKRERDAADREFEKRLRESDRQFVREFNEDNPGGCEECGAPFGLENAEVVADDGTHLIVHAECIGDRPMA